MEFLTRPVRAEGPRAYVRRVAPMLALAAIASIAGVQAQAPGAATEYEVKAAFLYNFGKFVEWPGDAFGSPTAAFVLCITGVDPFGDILDRTVDGKTIGGHPINVLRVARDGDLRACHLLFISASERKAIPDILARLRGAAVLIVGDTPGLSERGAMFNFVVEASKVRFEANPAAAERSGLHISSKLLALSRVVQSPESR